MLTVGMMMMKVALVSSLINNNRTAAERVQEKI
jgi:hypothetical protein